MHSIQSTEATPHLAVAPEAAQVIASPKLRAAWVNANELRTRVEAWDLLAKNSLWQNVAFEANYLLPALEHLATKDIRVLVVENANACLLYTSPSPRDQRGSRMPSSA